MRRPPGLWVLLSAGVLWLSLQDAYGIRATSLIFGKSSTTTTTTEHGEASSASDEENATTTDAPAANGTDSNSTKPTLTGNPQIDYVWDPNLPKELNGYNLSDYPFYERVPEDIDFKCDGLHDGFYASVKHKCQVYHHCLFGTRYDFLCANYTAFDQKTFICHFASEVDCSNSKKFWHRNDALYKAATTTTLRPLVVYTTASQLQPLTVLPPQIANPPQSPPPNGRKVPFRPLRRRRPAFDYYDDYYEDYYVDRPRSRSRKRIRHRQRPIYDDDSEEYYDEDETYERRGAGRRRPYDRRKNVKRRNRERDRPKYDYEDEDSPEDEDYSLSHRRKPSNRKKPPEDSREDRYPANRKQNRRRPGGDKRRRPHTRDYDDYESYERPKSKKEGPKGTKETSFESSTSIMQSSSGTLYNRPRAAPKIKPPVPKNAAEKYAHKPDSNIKKTVSEELETEEYYDDYDEPRQTKGNKKDESRRPIGSEEKNKARPRAKPLFETSRDLSDSVERSKHKDPEYEEYYDDYYDDNADTKTKASTSTPSSTTVKVTTKATTVSTTTTTTTTTVEPPIVRIDQPLIRLVKRPFLPSRGGNPYTARGLHPVGNRALHVPPDYSEETAPKEINTEEMTFRPSPALMPLPTSTFTAVGNIQEFQPQPDPRLTFRSGQAPRAPTGNISGSERQQDSGNYQSQSYKVSEELLSDTVLENNPNAALKSLQTAAISKTSRESRNESRASPVSNNSGASQYEKQSRAQNTAPLEVLLHDSRTTSSSNPSRSSRLRGDPLPNENTNPSSDRSRNDPLEEPRQNPKSLDKNPLDINASEYDVTLNDALNPSLSNLPFSYPNYRHSGLDQSVSSASADYIFHPLTNRHDVIPRRDVVSPVRAESYTVMRDHYNRPRQVQTQALYSRY